MLQSNSCHLFLLLMLVPGHPTCDTRMYLLMYVFENIHTQRLVSMCFSWPCYVLLFIQTGSALVMASFSMTDLWVFARKLAGGLRWPCVCKKEGNMFLKRTHSHPNNTGVDLENTATWVLVYLFCPSAYLLSHSLVTFINIKWLLFDFLIRKKQHAFATQPELCRNVSYLFFC